MEIHGSPTRSRDAITEADGESVELEDLTEEDHQPLLAQSTVTQSTNPEIDPWALACLLLQHVSR